VEEQARFLRFELAPDSRFVRASDISPLMTPHEMTLDARTGGAPCRRVTFGSSLPASVS